MNFKVDIRRIQLIIEFRINDLGGSCRLSLESTLREPVDELPHVELNVLPRLHIFHTVWAHIVDEYTRESDEQHWDEAEKQAELSVEAVHAPPFGEALGLELLVSSAVAQDLDSRVLLELNEHVAVAAEQTVVLEVDVGVHLGAG